VRQPYVVPRRRLVFAVWLTVLALPILVIDNIPRTEARAAPVTVDASRATATTAPTTLEPVRDERDVTTTTVEETTTTADAPSTTVKPKPATVAAPRSTSTTTTSAPPNTESGGASWYDWHPGECAHRTLPKGTVVTVTDLETGKSVTCVVTDRGPYGDSYRVIDLDEGTFAQLADPSRGVIPVEISW
jgi:rare lipoprotein A (peptidoglycan hydrolase)